MRKLCVGKWDSLEGETVKKNSLLAPISVSLLSESGKILLMATINTIVVITQINFFNSASLGFNKDHILNLGLPRDSISKTKWESFKQELLQQPGVQQVSFSFSPPAGRGANYTSIRFNQDIKDEDFELNIKIADVDFFKTYNIQLVAGRLYEPSDTLQLKKSVFEKCLVLLL